MRISIPQESFSVVLARCQSVLERKSTRPILENVLLEVFGSTLRISATDLRVSISREESCTVEQPGSIALPGRKLHEIVRELPPGDISLEVKENQWVTIASGKSVFHLPGAAAEDYPTLPTPPDSFVPVDARLFREMLEKTLFAASNDESRIHLCGVHMETVREADGGDLLRMVATDGHRLNLAEKAVQGNLQSFHKGIIIPKKGLAELKSLLEGIDGDFDIASAAGRIFAQVGSTVVSMTLIDASFPNYRQVVPEESPSPLRVRRGALIDAVKRVSLLSDQETHSVVVQTNGPVAVLTSTNPQIGDAREEIEIEHDGEAIRIAFNAAYMLDALRAISGDEIILSLGDALAPCLLRGSADPGFLCVVMPMRID